MSYASYFDNILAQAEFEVTGNNILKLSEIRRTIRADCSKRIMDNYGPLWKVWRHCMQNDQM